MSPIARFKLLEDYHGRHELLLLLLTAVFVAVNAVALNLVQEGVLSLSSLWAPAVWFIAIGAAHLVLARTRPGHDPYLLPIVALLSGWGLVLLQRLAPNFLDRQTLWLLIGLAVLLAVAVLPPDLRWLRRYRYTWLLAGLLLLAATLVFGVNPSGFGATLWLPIPFIGRVFFQPSELLKLLLVIFLASYFEERESLLPLKRGHGRFGPLPYLAPLLLMWGFCMVLLIWQRDLGAATLFFALFLTLLYLAAGDWRYVAGGLGLLLLASFFAYYAFDVVALRVDAWLNPWPDADNRAFQIVQSLYAVAAGGVLGQGVGQGFPTYIPVVHSDFAFAAIAEEWGLVGSLSVVACYMVLAQRGLRLALHASRPFHRYLAAGITVLFVAQALLIMGGVTRLLPLTGVTLPFLSYGGSSMLISSIMVGLLLYLSADQAARPGQIRHPQALAYRIRRLTVLVLVGYLLVSLSLLYWSVLRADDILAREDNPRLVEAELRIQRGRILARDGTILAETVGTPENRSRQYPIANIGPAVGYYSFRHGTAGVEEGYDAVLRRQNDDPWMNQWQQLLHLPQHGRDVRISLDARLQQTADALLGEQQGAILLLDNQTGEILALASHPGYDPNLLDEQFDNLTAAEDAPLLNRAVQGQYQPGLLVQPLLLAAALDAGLITLEAPVAGPNRPVRVDGQRVGCLTAVPEPATWADVLAHRCPGPMQALAARWERDELAQIFALSGLTDQPELALNTDTGLVAPLAEMALAGIGQDSLVVTPLQVALAWQRLTVFETVPAPRLVLAVQAEDSASWQPVEPADSIPSPLSARAVSQIQQVLSGNGRIEFGDRVLSGPDGSTNAWYVGSAPAENPRYTVVVVLENSGEVGVAQGMGRGLLDTAVARP